MLIINSSQIHKKYDEYLYYILSPEDWGTQILNVCEIIQVYMIWYLRISYPYMIPTPKRQLCIPINGEVLVVKIMKCGSVDNMVLGCVHLRHDYHVTLSWNYTRRLICRHNCMKNFEENKCNLAFEEEVFNLISCNPVYALFEGCFVSFGFGCIVCKILSCM